MNRTPGAARARGFAALSAIAVLVATSAAANGQEPPATPPAAPASDPSSPAAPDKVEVEPVARDEQIARRLERILKATGWFTAPGVKVDEGVVFLSGTSQSEAHKKWAGDLARNTQDVVAVVNQMAVEMPTAWDFGPALAGVREIGHDVIYSLPFTAFGILTLILFFGLAKVVSLTVRRLTRRRIQVSLLREVTARGLGLVTLLFGLYVVLKVAGLTRLAVTVLGGTGLFGLVIGIAFRDITENFLASVLLSMQRPFRTGDLVEIAGTLGYVRQLNVRTTILMAVTGALVQIPNATVYKSTLRNFTSNPNRREEVTIGIGYDATIDEAQEIALGVLAGHPAVLQNPEPWVLVDALGSATVNLRVYFWLDGTEHSWLKVRSSVLRLIKRAFQEHEISMPDESREVVFPDGVPVRITGERQEEGTTSPEPLPPKAEPAESKNASTDAEGGLSTDAGEIERQARNARLPESGADLLNVPPPDQPP